MSDKKSTIAVREIHGMGGEAFFNADGGLMSYKGQIKISERIVSSGESLGEMMAQFANMGMGAPLQLIGPAEKPAPRHLTGPADEGTVLSVSATRSPKRDIDVAALEEALKARPPKSKPKFDGKHKMCTSDKCETRVLGEHKMISELCVLGCRMRYKSVLKNGSEKCNCANIHGGAHCTADMGDHSTHSAMCLCAKYHKEAIQQAIANVNQMALEKGQHASRLDLPSSASKPDRRPGVKTLTREWQGRVDSDEKNMQQGRQLPTSHPECGVKDGAKSESDVFYCPSAQESLLASMAAGLQADVDRHVVEQEYPAEFDECPPADYDMMARAHVEAQSQAEAYAASQSQAEAESC